MEKTKFKTGDRVIYGSYGLCSIHEIKSMDPMGGHEMREYYVLKPLSSPSSTYFVPLDSEAMAGKLRYTLSKEEIDDILTQTQGKEISWIDDRNLRANTFHDILQNGMKGELLLMIRCILSKKAQLSQNGRRLPSAAETTLRSAENLVAQEFSYVLDMPQDQVGDYIKTALQS